MIFTKVYVTTTLSDNQLFTHYFWWFQKEWLVGETIEWRPWSTYGQNNRLWVVVNSIKWKNTLLYHLTPTTSKMLSVGENVVYNDKQLGVMS